MNVGRGRDVQLAMRGLLALLCAAALGGCADPPASNYPTQQIYVEDTTLGPGDVFEVRVFQQDKLSSIYAASSEGTISFPLIGAVTVTGKTAAMVEREIRDRLADGFLKDPQVSILVKEYKSKKVSVFGEVRKPGTLPFTEGMTIVEAIAQAGGFSAMARGNAVTVTRVSNNDKQTYTVPVDSIGKGKAKQFYIRPGDVVHVPARRW
jgi:protein involved in polysaccharide export with SLBB domain